MKTVLMFKRAAICYDSVNYFSRRIGEELRKYGINIKWLNITGDMTQISHDLTQLVTESAFNAAIAVNSIGQETYQVNGTNLYDFLEIPFFNLLLDHPVAHLNYLSDGPTNYQAICIDREHTDYLNRFLPNISKTHFIPLGPAENDYEKRSFEDFLNRDIDLLFTGANKELSKIENDILALPKTGRFLVTNIIDFFLDNRHLSLDDTLRHILKDNGIDADNNAEYLNYSVTLLPAQQYCMAYLREEIVRYVASSDIRFQLYGGGWNEIVEECGINNTVTSDSVPYEYTPKLCQRSRLTLNIMPIFRDGSHDRIPTSIANGAGVLTDPTKYLTEIFEENEGVYFYDISHPEKIVSFVNNILSDPEKIWANVKKGQKKVSDHLSWSTFAYELSNLL